MWHNERAWGVIDSDYTPGGCFTLFTSIQTDGYPGLVAGQQVNFEWEPTEMANFAFRTIRVQATPTQR